MAGRASWAQPNLWIVALLFALVALAFAVSCVRRSIPGERLVVSVRLGVAWVLIAVIAVGMPVIPREAVVLPYCLSNLKQQALGMIMYAADYDDRFPLAPNWHDATMRYVKNEFHCPLATAKWSYAMNARASGLLSYDERLADLVLLFEANARLPNASGGPEWLAFRHDGGTNVATFDARVHARTREQAAALQWDP